MRETAHNVYCDGPNCKAIAQVADQSTEAPEGWYMVVPAIPDPKVGFTYNRLAKAFEFHTLSCVQKWAKGRQAFEKQKDKRLIPPHPQPLIVGSGDNSRKQIAQETRAKLVEVLSIDSNEFLDATTISELAKLHSSTARNHLKAMESEGLLEMKQEVSSRGGPLYLYRLKPE